MSSLPLKFKTQFPAATFTSADHLDDLEPLLRSLDLLDSAESILATEKPGEGNMNFVLRVKTSGRSFILKQSRPWVEKYPQIAAPVERLQAEAAYYRFTANEPCLRAMSPSLLAVDSTNLVMLTSSTCPSDRATASISIPFNPVCRRSHSLLFKTKPCAANSRRWVKSIWVPDPY